MGVRRKQRRHRCAILPISCFRLIQDLARGVCAHAAEPVTNTGDTSLAVFGWPLRDLDSDSQTDWPGVELHRFRSWPVSLRTRMLSVSLEPGFVAAAASKWNGSQAF